ncbi:MAG: segregation/condensation protein A [Clostridia bacterium]|nr:segregation/condensation protein A [Clostridia bacterium]
MEKISYKLEAFEGPLDLLLHLIEKNKLNIYDIQISELLEQYMEHIELMQQQDLDIAGEFLAMASKLVQIKSAMLLPKFEEAEEMRRELSGQLIEYQKCKKVAKLLSDNISFDSFCREQAKIKADMTYKRSHEPSYLTAAYLTAAGRGKAKLPPPENAFSGIVKRRIVSVSSRIISIMKKLWGGQKRKYSSIFEDASDKSELVATFLAVLELIKGKRVRIEGEGNEQELKLISGGGKNWKKEK